MHKRGGTRSGTRILPSAVVLLALGTITVYAEEPPGTTTAQNQVQQTETTGKDEPTCIWACLRWSRWCNVDPRGVYKCHRRCEKFGQQCE